MGRRKGSKNKRGLKARNKRARQRLYQRMYYFRQKAKKLEEQVPTGFDKGKVEVYLWGILTGIATTLAFVFGFGWLK